MTPRLVSSDPLTLSYSSVVLKVRNDLHKLNKILCSHYMMSRLLRTTVHPPTPPNQLLDSHEFYFLNRSAFFYLCSIKLKRSVPFPEFPYLLLVVSGKMGNYDGGVSGCGRSVKYGLFVTNGLILVSFMTTMIELGWL